MVKKKKLILFFLVLCFVVSGLALLSPSKPSVKILSYSSFLSDWGAGPALKKKFEAECDCRVQFVSVGSAGFLLPSYKIRDNVDLVLGLSGNEKKIDEFSHLFEDISSFHKKIGKKEILLDEKFLLPYDWAPLSFLYDENKLQKKLSEKDIFKNKKLLLGVDFEKSSLGGVLGKWLRIKKKQNQAAFLLEENIFPSWSEMYGFFTENKDEKLAFSYLTSLVYHWEKKQMSYKHISLEKYPFQVEFIALSKASKNKKIAKRFIEFLVSEPAQRVIMARNYMLPIRKKYTKGTLFEKIPFEVDLAY